MKKQQGFTLIEVIVVISILAVLVGLAVPSLEGLGHQQGRREVKEEFARFQQGAQLLAKVMLQRTPKDLVNPLAELQFSSEIIASVNIIEPGVLKGSPGSAYLSYWWPEKVKDVDPGTSATYRYLDPWGRSFGFPGSNSMDQTSSGVPGVMELPKGLPFESLGPNVEDTSDEIREALDWQKVAIEEGLFRVAVAKTALQQYFSDNPLSGLPAGTEYIDLVTVDPLLPPAVKLVPLYLNDSDRWKHGFRADPSVDRPLQFAELLGAMDFNPFRVTFSIDPLPTNAEETMP